MAKKVPLKTSQFQPGLETEHVVGLSGVGVSVVHFTLSCNTVQTMAEIIGGVPNVTGVPANIVVHSLGAPPTAFFVQVAPVGAVLDGVAAGVSIQHITSNNSAVYVYAQHFTAAPRGVAARLVAIR